MRKSKKRRSQMRYCVCKMSLSIYSNEHSHPSVPEHRITNEFTNAQHPLTMAGVSKHLQKSVITLLPAAQSPSLWITNSAWASKMVRVGCSLICVWKKLANISQLTWVLDCRWSECSD
jgi:hypothetical protein